MTPPPARTRVLSTAEERREAVLEAAIGVFAARGLHGTPTTEIARAAGISHAYLFRLFPTKIDLFVALTERCFKRIRSTFGAAAARARAEGAPVLPAMGAAYVDLLRDRDVLMLQLHSHAASDDPQIREATRDGWRGLYALVERESNAAPADIRAFFAQGMLLNVMAAIDAEQLGEHWADVLRGTAPE